MHRSVSILGAVCLLLLVTVAPAAAASAPRIHESGTVTEAFAYTSSCDASSCTDTQIDVFTVQLDKGTTDTSVCFNSFTYPLHGRGGSSTSGCATASSFTVASDLSSATLGATTIPVDTCSQRRCTSSGTVTVSGTFTATQAASPYSYKSTYKNADCTERYSVKGANAPATFNGTLNDTSFSAGDGSIVQEHYSFSSTCV